MRKKAITITLLSLAIVTAGYGLVQAHGSYNWGHMGSGYNMMGGGYGDHMGFGHMMDYRPRTNDYCWTDDRAAARDLTREDAEAIIGNSVIRTNPNLKVGKVKVTEDGFEVQVVTKKGEALVDRLLVEKDSGRVYRVYE